MGKARAYLGLAFDRAPAVGLSHALGDVLRETGQDPGLLFPSGGNLLSTVDSACRWFLGRELPPGLSTELSDEVHLIGWHFNLPNIWRRLDHWPPTMPAAVREPFWSACREAVLKTMVELRDTPARDSSWNLICSALAGRLAALREPRQAVVLLAGWLDHCRTMWAPGENGGALGLGVAGLAEGAAACNCEKDLERLLERETELTGLIRAEETNYTRSTGRPSVSGWVICRRLVSVGRDT